MEKRLTEIHDHGSSPCMLCVPHCANLAHDRLGCSNYDLRGAKTKSWADPRVVQSKKRSQKLKIKNPDLTLERRELEPFFQRRLNKGSRCGGEKKGGKSGENGG